MRVHSYSLGSIYIDVFSITLCLNISILESTKLERRKYKLILTLSSHRASIRSLNPGGAPALPPTSVVYPPMVFSSRYANPATTSHTVATLLFLAIFQVMAMNRWGSQTLSEICCLVWRSPKQTLNPSQNALRKRCSRRPFLPPDTQQKLCSFAAGRQSSRGRLESVCSDI